MTARHDDPVIDRINEGLVPIQVENLTKDLSTLLRSMSKHQLEEYLPKILKGVCEPVSEFLENNGEEHFASVSWEPWYKSAVVRIKNMISMLNDGKNISIDPLDRLPKDEFVSRVDHLYRKI